MSDEPDMVNPYEAPQALPEEVIGSDAEAIRTSYISLESSIKSISLVHMLTAMPFAFALLGAIEALHQGLTSTWPGDDRVMEGVIGVLVAGSGSRVIGLFCLWVIGTKEVGPRPRTWLSVVGLLLFPVGTIVNAYFLYLLRSDKAAFVFSDEYREVIRQTPHVVYKTAGWLWVVLGIAILLAIAILTLVYSA